MPVTALSHSSPLTDWLHAPDPDRAVHLARDREGWDRVPYPELASDTRQAAARLIAAGVVPGDVVCLLMPTGRACLAMLYGVLAAGATMCPLMPPSFQGDQRYTEHVAAILEQAGPRLVVTDQEYVPLAARAMELAGRTDQPWVPDEDSDTAPGQAGVRPNGELALLQFTSGSTGTPRGVRVTWDNLAANFAVIGRATEWQDGDGLASWLPLHHDMGLIGACLYTVARQGDLWLMRPDQFIRDPARWLECLSDGRAAIAPCPSFGFAYTARRVRPERLAALDLSGWRTVCVGAEAVDAAALDTFARLTAPAGFDPRAFTSSYGLAENTLIVTAARGELPLLRPDWSALRLGAPVTVRDTSVLGKEPVAPGAGWLAGHGLPDPADGIGVRVIDEEAGTLPDGTLGEIAVTGSSVAHGYHGGGEGRSTRFVDGELRTGDAGFLHEGHLYILGRMGDSLKLRGRNVYVEEYDAQVAAAAGLDKDRVAVVAVNDRGTAGLAVFVEAAPGPWTEKVAALLRGEFGPAPSLILVSGRRGMLKRTSSGKLRRRHLWDQLQSGTLKGAVVAAPPGRGAGGAG